MTHKTEWTNRFLMGKTEEGNIYLSPPSWDCGWYWGFGYLGNRNCHYHLSGIDKDKNMYDALKHHFGESLTIPDCHLWQFCELIKTAYALKETAEVLDRGGSHYTNNPCSEIIKNKEETDRINSIVLPAIFNAINNILKDCTPEAKIKRQKAEAEALKNKILEQGKASLKKAQIEADGLSWWVECGFSVKNCIYYGHKDVFCFGWRNALTKEECNRLLDVISEFPYAYELKCNDGRVLTHI